MAIAISGDGSRLAVVAATAVAFYDTASFAEVARDPMRVAKQIDAALFAAGDRVLMALSRDTLYEKQLAGGDKINQQRICLPEGSGPQIAVLATPDLLLFAERRCSSSGLFDAANQVVAPGSLYGVNAYALAYDRQTNLLYTTERAGYLTIYKVPRAAVAH
jgi:hypothetical protein